MNKLITCKCGCNNTTKKFNKWGYERTYIMGHGWKNKKHTESSKKQISISHLKRPRFYNKKFFLKWSDDLAYFIGLMLADGCVTDSYHLVISLIDKEPIIYFSQKIKANNRKTSKGLFELSLNDKNLKSTLKELCLFPRKTKCLKWPKVPKKYIPDFIRGFFDGDGCVGLDIDHYYKDKVYYKPYVSIGTQTYSFLVRMKRELKCFGIDIKAKIKIKKDCNYLSIASQNNFIKFFKLIYTDKNCICIKRKYNKFLYCLDKIKKEKR